MNGEGKGARSSVCGHEPQIPISHTYLSNVLCPSLLLAPFAVLLDAVVDGRPGEQCAFAIKINKFPRNHKVKLFRVPVSADRTDYVVTNDVAQNSAKATREECGLRWKSETPHLSGIEQFHRELKQTTGLEKCQCRKGRIQRNHIACAMLVWVRLKHIANKTGKTVYQLKRGLLDEYLVQQLRNPAITMANA